MATIEATYQSLGSGTSNLPLISWFLTSLAASCQNQDKLLEPKEKVTPITTTNLLPEYDFIVIGAGTSGSVVASRLSEEMNWKVLLIEAGLDESAASDVPLISDYLQLSDVDWGYQTRSSNTSCLAMYGNRCNILRGKSLGGTSSVNFMHYIRGNKKDYDDWEALGNTGWSYKDVLPYFKKSEDNNNSSLTSTIYHSKGGYLSVSDSQVVSGLASAFVKGGSQMGYKVIDYNGAQQTGFRSLQGTLRNGRRCSTAKAFLRPAKHRTNLHILTNTFATKINVNDATKRAESVNMLKDGALLTIKATKEIITAAGPINSPQLLMLSGIGPASHLSEIGIKVIKNLPVGRNLQDHVSFGGAVFKINTTDSIIQSQIREYGEFRKYAENGVGTLTSMCGADVVGFVNTCYSDFKKDFPDIQLVFAPESLLSDDQQFKKVHGLRDEFYNAVYKSNENAHAWTAYPVLLRPKSRGYVKLRNCNPFEKPLIIPDYFCHPDDIAVLREGVKAAIKLSKTPALNAFNSTFYNISYPACSNLKFLSDGFIECMIRQYTFSFNNPAGTCKMGPDCDRTSVVDPTLKVRGISSLRVVGSSIMPNIISGSTNTASVMIAEKASDMIKQCWKK